MIGGAFVHAFVSVLDMLGCCVHQATVRRRITHAQVAYTIDATGTRTPLDAAGMGAMLRSIESGAARDIAGVCVCVAAVVLSCGRAVWHSHAHARVQRCKLLFPRPIAARRGGTQQTERAAEPCDSQAALQVPCGAACSRWAARVPRAPCQVGAAATAIRWGE